MTTTQKKYRLVLAGTIAGVVLVCAGLWLAALSNPRRFSLDVKEDRQIGLLVISGFACTIAGIGLLLKAGSYTTKKKKLFWQIPVLLVLSLAALGLWSPSWLTGLPVLRGLKVHWCAIRLTSDDPEIQASAARVLGDMGPKAKRAVPALIEALDSSRSEIRDAAARALGEIGPDAEAAVESLIRIQKTERKFLTVEKALGQIGEPGLEPFITGLQDKDASVREHAAESLGRIFLVVEDRKLVQKAMQPLINALHDEDMRVSMAAARAVPGIVPTMKDPETRATVAKALIRAMKDRGVSPYDTGALLKIAEAGLEPVISALEDEYTPARPVVPAVVDPESRGTTVERLIRIMADREEMRGFGALALGKIGLPAFEPLIAALQDEDARVRTAAALAMQQVLPAVRDPETRARAVEPLIRAMKDEVGPFRYALAALGKIGEPALEPFIADLQDKNPLVREQAAESLGSIIPFVPEPTLTQKAMQLLINALQDKDVRVRRAAARALHGVVSAVKAPETRARAVEPLIRALKDTDHEVHVYAAAALGEIGPNAGEAIPALVEALKDEEIGGTAADALAQIGPKAVPALIRAATDEDTHVRGCAITALGKIGPDASQAVPVLIDAFESRDVSIRVAGAVSLGQLGPSAKEAIPTLVQALEGNDRHVRVHSADALRNLGWQDRERLLAVLIEALKDDNTCACAAAALSEFGSEASEAVPALLDLRKDTRSPMRSAAAEALKKIDPKAAADAGLK